MSRETQINELAAHIQSLFGSTSMSRAMASLLYDEGYRKQSEGKWEKRVFIIFDTEKVGYRCSSCNTTWDTPTAYCPHCGAKMKGGGE